VRNRQLHLALAAFAQEAAGELAAATAGGDEVGFELDVRGSRDAPLYLYRPLTGAFIDERASLLGRLPAYVPALHALQGCGGLDAYLVARGEVQVPRSAREQAEEVLRLFLARCFAETTDFTLSTERLGAAMTELEDLVLDGRATTEVVVPVLGLAVASEVVALGEGLELLDAAAAGDLPAACAAGTVARVTWDAAPGDETPLTRAQVALRRMLVALRLYDAAAVALGPTGWSRTAGGPWQAWAVDAPAAVRGVLAVPPAQEDELRAFCSLVTRRTPRAGELAWALRRFELAAERPSAAEALTDVLLALRALLADPDGTGPLADRVAVLCAVPENRATVENAVRQAVALERAVVAGVGPQPEALTGVVDELSGFLRALLRDVLCGHLDPDLRRLADALRAEADEARAHHG
jgi:hypothetical protein